MAGVVRKKSTFRLKIRMLFGAVISNWFVFQGLSVEEIVGTHLGDFYNSLWLPKALMHLNSDTFLSKLKALHR